MIRKKNYFKKKQKEIKSEYQKNNPNMNFSGNRVIFFRWMQNIAVKNRHVYLF